MKLFVRFGRNGPPARDGGDIPIFADSPENWRARLKSYPGDERDVERAMWNQTFPTEVVAKKLFRDRTLSKELRSKLLVGLGRQCIRFNMLGPIVAYKGRPDYLEGRFVEPEAEVRVHLTNLERAESSYRRAAGARGTYSALRG
jgi:hypothetical protein